MCGKQEQEQALEQSEHRMVELHREAQKEAELSRRQADELRYLSEREERLRTDQQVNATDTDMYTLILVCY